MAKISVLVSSAGRKSLLVKCLESLFIQNEPDVQIYVAVPQTHLNELDLFLCRYFFTPDHKKQKSYTLVPISDHQVSEGRNWAIKNAEEGILLLLDEDVSLPDPSYIKRLASFHAALTRIEILGGAYISTPECSLAGRAYNQVARVWIEKHRNPEVIGVYNDLLVAGNLSIKLNRKTRSALFPSEDGFGGEELRFLKEHWKLGHSSRVIEGLGVHHHAQHSLKTFYSRAWLHGSKTQGGLKLSSKDIQSILRHSGKGSERLMVCSYLLFSRAPRLFKNLQDLQRFVPTR